MVSRIAAATMNPGVRHQLEDTDWQDVGIRLAGYATWKARNRSWRNGCTDSLPGGRTAEDLAHEAICKVLEGNRAWDPRRGELLPFLQGVVDSLLSHLADSFDNRVTRFGAGAVREAVEPEPDCDPRDRIADLRTLLRENGDDRLLAVVDAILHGCEPKPQAVAQLLQITVTDVNNRLKRLRRLAMNRPSRGRDRPGEHMR